MTSTSSKNRLYESYVRLKGWTKGAESNDVPHDVPAIVEEYYRKELKRANFRAGVKVLELGFGEGLFLDWAHAQGAEVAGVEILPELCERVAKRHRAIFEGTLPQLVEQGAIEGPFDLIVAFDVFEHLSKEELIEHFQAFARILNPQGQVMARFPNGQSPFGRIYQHGDLTHKTVLGPYTLKQIGLITGFALAGVYNTARVTSKHPLKKAYRSMTYAARNAIEHILGSIYFAGRVPLDPNLTVVMQKEPSSS